jgi:hypothetical protein
MISFIKTSEKYDCIVYILDRNLQAFNHFSIVRLSSLGGGLSSETVLKKGNGKKKIVQDDEGTERH